MYLTYEQVKKLKFKKGNRPVQMTHVKQLLNKKGLIKNGMWNMFEPVIINRRTGCVMNGQHRTTGYIYCIENGLISRTTKLKVEYVDIPEEQEIDAIRDMNGGKNWNNDTIIESKAAEGNLNYVQLVKFCEEHDLCHKGKRGHSYRAAVAMMTGRRFNADKEEFIFTPEKGKKGEKVHDELLVILQILNIARGDAGVEGMAQTWFYIRDDHKWSEWKKMIASSKRVINTRRTPGKTEWETFFENVSYKIDKKAKEQSASI